MEHRKEILETLIQDVAHQVYAAFCETWIESMPTSQIPQSREDIQFLKNDEKESGRYFKRKMSQSSLERTLKRYVQVISHLSHTRCIDDVPWTRAVFSKLIHYAELRPFLFAQDYQDGDCSQALQTVTHVLKVCVYEHLYDNDIPTAPLTEANLAAHRLRTRGRTASSVAHTDRTTKTKRIPLH
jgi:hypothetical protein